MNYYEILEVSVNASKEVIKNAYRALTKKYHPDSYKGNQEYAQEKMKEINEAYEILMDDNKRLMYDYENGFKIDPNAPKNEIELKEEDIKVEENKEDAQRLTPEEMNRRRTGIQREKKPEQIEVEQHIQQERIEQRRERQMNQRKQQQQRRQTR